MSARFEVRKVPDGWQIWDLQRDQAHEQPGLKHSHWSPSRSRAQAWVERETATGASGVGGVGADWAPGAQVHPTQAGYEARRV